MTDEQQQLLLILNKINSEQERMNKSLEDIASSLDSLDSEIWYFLYIKLVLWTLFFWVFIFFIFRNRELFIDLLKLIFKF